MKRSRGDATTPAKLPKKELITSKNSSFEKVVSYKLFVQSDFPKTSLTSKVVPVLSTK